MAACLRRPPLTQRVPSPAAYSQLPGAEWQLDRLPPAQGTYGCGEDLSLLGRLPPHFLPLPDVSSVFRITAGGLVAMAADPLFTERKINPGVCFEEWLHHFHSPNNNYFTTRNSFFWIEHLFHPGIPSYNANSPPEECAFLYQMEPGTSFRGETARPHPHTMLTAATLPPTQIVPDSCCEALAQGRTGVTVATINSGWDPQLSLHMAMFLKSHDQKLKIGDGHQTACQSARCETSEKWRNSKQHNLLMFRDKCTFMFIFDFRFYFPIACFKNLSRVSHKRTRARMFGNLTDDI